MSRTRTIPLLVLLLLPLLLATLPQGGAVAATQAEELEARRGGDSWAGRVLFPVYWQAPTFQCRSHGIHWEKEAARWPGLVVNVGDAWRGPTSAILYDPGDFPALLLNDTVTDDGRYYWRNGGLPQLGSLAQHLRQLDRHVHEQVPDAQYSGLLVLDFESWRPVYRQNFGSLQPYRKLSVDVERALHPTWTVAQLEAEARRRFELAGRPYVQETLTRVSELRRRARIGYYAYPYCWNTVQSDDGACSEQVRRENDAVVWLWQGVGMLLPSLYGGAAERASEEAVRRRWYATRVVEAARLRDKFGSGEDSLHRQRQLVLPYWWYRWRDLPVEVPGALLDAQQVRELLEEMWRAGADGSFLWGSSKDVSSKRDCLLLVDWLHQVLGPTLQNFTSSLT